MPMEHCFLLFLITNFPYINLEYKPSQKYFHILNFSHHCPLWTSTSYSKYVTILLSACFIFIVLWNVLLYFSTISSSLSMYTVFVTTVIFKILGAPRNKNSRLPFIVCWIHISIIIMQPRLTWAIVKVAALIYPPYVILFATRFF